jgi:hypothetical protein
MDLSILIVNWNARDLLLDCLRSVYRTLRGVTFEVLVVDNGSRDGSVAAVRRAYPPVRLIENEQNVGFARANNQAMRASRGRYVLLLNSDTVVRPGALSGLVRFADRHPEVGIAGSRLVNPNGSLQPSWARFPSFWSEALDRNVRHRVPMAREPWAYEVDWVGGACLLARREAIEQVGLLDEGFFMYSEEADWCYRMVQHGWKVAYLETAEVIHLGGGSSRMRSDAMAVELYRSKLRFFRKHYGRIPAAALRVALAARFLVRGTIYAGLHRLGGARRPLARRMASRQHLLLRGITRSSRL